MIVFNVLALLFGILVTVGGLSRGASAQNIMQQIAGALATISGIIIIGFAIISDGLRLVHKEMKNAVIELKRITGQ